MYVITVIAAQGTLREERVLAFLTALAGTHWNWLAAGEAADIFVDQQPDQFDQVWAQAQQEKIDLVLQVNKNRKKKLLLADMDSTMIGQECIDELADMAGVGEQVKDITARAMNGELDFEKALKSRVALLKGLPLSIIDKVIQERITFTDGGKLLIDTMKRHGAYCALVSGGFTAFTAYVAQSLGFDEHRANSLLVTGDTLTGEVGLPIVGRDAKVTALEELSLKLGITAAEVIAVGDGANDLGMLQCAGLGVALHAKPTVAAQTNVVINFGNLRSLCFMQGYSL
ncbi:MAG: phosphoserine phosphatase SerB [Paracoccaceae bacterium]|jgi:phosphoserine phosphatase